MGYNKFTPLASKNVGGKEREASSVEGCRVWELG